MIYFLWYISLQFFHRLFCSLFPESLLLSYIFFTPSFLQLLCYILHGTPSMARFYGASFTVPFPSAFPTSSCSIFPESLLLSYIVLATSSSLYLPCYILHGTSSLGFFSVFSSSLLHLHCYALYSTSSVPFVQCFLSCILPATSSTVRLLWYIFSSPFPPSSFLHLPGYIFHDTSSLHLLQYFHLYIFPSFHLHLPYICSKISFPTPPLHFFQHLLCYIFFVTSSYILSKYFPKITADTRLLSIPLPRYHWLTLHTT